MVCLKLAEDIDHIKTGKRSAPSNLQTMPEYS